MSHKLHEIQNNFSKNPLVNGRQNDDKYSQLGEVELRQKLMEKDDIIEDLKICLARVEAELKYVQKQVVVPQISKEDLNVAIRASLPMLTPNQVALMTNEKKRVNWTNNEISNGFAHSFFSRRGYNYSIHQLQIPQPSIRTLQRWGESLTIAPGVLEDCLVILKGFRNTLTEGESQVIINFDEMKCKTVYEYNKTLDSIMGPSSQMQTVMVRGQFSKFKQPIYLGFDIKITPDIIDLLSTKLHNVGYNVVGAVCDNGGGNVGLWSNCGVNFEKTAIKHPQTGEDIFMFSDAPHLLKLLRNWFIDGGFLLQDGTELNQYLIRQLIQMNTEITPIFRLTLKHLEVAGFERQNVRMASQLFSHSVAQTLLRMFPSNEVAKTLAKFIELVNNWFDIMNSYSINGIGFKRPYGVGLEEQNAVLNEMYSTIKNMKCFNKKKELQNTLQIFQKGILMSITSIRALRTKMELKFGYKYILTHRNNQDCLENFYSQVRYRNGASDHPTPVECLNNIKGIILGKNPGVSAQMHANTTEREPEEYASVTFYEALGDTESNDAPCNAGIKHSAGLDVEDNFHEINDVCDVSEEFLDYSAYYVAEEYIEDYTDEDVADRIVTDFAVECPEDFKNEEIVIDLNVELLEHFSNEMTTEFLEDLSTDMLIDETKTKRLQEDGLEYIAGWIALKLKSQNPNFSRSKRENLPSHVTDHTYSRLEVNSSSWIDTVSYGGLTKPSEQVFRWVKELEKEFLRVHGNEFNNRVNVKKELVKSLLTNCNGVPEEIIALFARSRIYMRCKYLNQKRAEEALLKKAKNARKRKGEVYEESSRSKSKKMNKVIL